MVNNPTISAAAGSGAYSVHAELELQSLLWEGAGYVGTVRSRLAVDRQCPRCMQTQRVNSVRMAHYRDIPYAGKPVRLAWKRRLFVCDNCLLPSVETHPAFDDKHYVTRRLLDWIFHESGHRPLTALASEVGVSKKWISQLLERADFARESADPWIVKRIAFELVPVFGPLRPVVFDMDTQRVIDVFPSIEALIDYLAAHSISFSEHLSAETVVSDVGLESSFGALLSIYVNAAHFVNPASLIREATSMMEAAASGAIAEQAAREHMAAQTGRILFARRTEKELGRNGRRRLLRWQHEASSLYTAYRLKEQFTKDWAKNDLQRWPNWVVDARRLAGIDYGPVITLVESNLGGLQGFIREARKMGGFAAYQAKANEIAGMKLEGVYSFAGARAAVLSKYGVQAGDSVSGPAVLDGGGV
jgi:hypothetical protein